MIKSPEPTLWNKAKENVPQCPRCIDWNNRGLSYHCPVCDGLVIDEFQKLLEAQNAN